MVVVGTDAHKYSHTFVATDEVGRQLGEKTVKATTAGHATAIMWAREQFGLELIWGIEDCRNMSARLERDLLAAGQQVVRVPTKLMAQTRKSARSRGKSDPIDALAVARAVLRETDLPLATHDETSRELKLLTDRRDVLVAQRTSAINRLRWLVHELDPERAPAARSLDAAKHQQALRTWLDTQPGLVAELARAELTDIIRLTGEINTLAQRISARVHQVAPALLEIPGCAELTAAKIVGEAAGVTRFKSEAAGSHPGVVGQHRRPDAAQPLGQPPAQRRPTPHRTDPNPDDRQPGPGLLPKAARRRENQTRSTTLPQTPPSPHRLPGPAHRPPAQLRTHPTRGRLP